MKLINLLPREEQKELRMEIISSQVTSFWVFAVLSLGALFALSFAAEVLIKQGIDNENEAIAAQKRSLEAADIREVERDVTVLNNNIRTIKNLQTQHYYWSKALVEIGNLTPIDMSFDLLSLDRTTGKVEVSGSATNRTSVIEFWANVKKSALFRNIDFPLANLEKANNGTFQYSFFVNEAEIKKP